MASDSTVIPSESKLQLYSYFRSTCSWRVRIALNLKELKYEYKAVNLLKGEQFSPEYAKLNPLNLVPALVDGDICIIDSLAIIMYLDEKHPQHPLLPQDLHRKAINFQAANIVCSSIQPFQNLSVLNYIEQKINSDEKLVWAQYHITRGFAALEKLLKPFSGRYATGDDVFLVLRPFAFGIGWHKAAQRDSTSSHLDWIGAQFLGLWAGLGFYRLSGCLGLVLGKSPTRSLFRLLYADLNVGSDSEQDGLGQALPGLVHVAAYLVAFAES